MAPLPEWNNEIYDPQGVVSKEEKPAESPKKPLYRQNSALQPRKHQQNNIDNDLFDMNHGNFKEYNNEDEIIPKSTPKSQNQRKKWNEKKQKDIVMPE